MTTATTHPVNADHFDCLSEIVLQNKTAIKAIEDTNRTLQRPITDTKMQESSLENKSFGAYIRKGETAPLNTKEMSSTDSEGGYLIPQELSTNIAERLKERSFFRKLAKVTQISTDALETLSAENDLDVGWTQEKDSRDPTDTPACNKIRIIAHELYARPRATQRLIDDASINIEDWISNQITAQMAEKETAAFIKGDGQGKPHGFLHAAAAENSGVECVKSKKDGAFDDAKPEHTLLDMIHALKTPYLNGAAWIMSRSAEAQVRKLKEPNHMHYIWEPATRSGDTASLLGYPVYVTDHMPALAAGSQSIVFGNFKEAYHIVDRGDVHMLRDPYSAKPFVEFYTTKRVGGDLINSDALVTLKFAK